MTTNVLILAGHWPVLVTAIDAPTPDRTEPLESEVMVVQPGTHGMSYITSTRELRVTELPPVAPAVPPAPVLAEAEGAQQNETDGAEAAEPVQTDLTDPT